MKSQDQQFRSFSILQYVFGPITLKNIVVQYQTIFKYWFFSFFLVYFHAPDIFIKSFHEFNVKKMISSLGCPSCLQITQLSRTLTAAT